jgi:hypothetical protein
MLRDPLHHTIGTRARWIALGGAGLSLAVYLVAIHPWMAQWGSVAAERQRQFPGAELVPFPAKEETRSITVRAPASTVWRWLGQIGQGRGGFYSYDWLENLVGANIHNVYQLRPELQPPIPGDTIRLTSDRYLGGRATRMTALPVVSVEPGRSFVLGGWGTFVVDSLGPAKTRLIVRERIPAMTLQARLLRTFVFDPMHFIMERQMLRVIRDLSEERPRAWLPQAVAVFGFALSGLVLLGIFARRHRWISIAVLTVIPLVVIVFTGDWRSGLVALVGLGLPRLAATELRPPGWLTVPVIVVLVTVILLSAPDAYLVLGWILGAGALATPLVGYFIADREPNDFFSAPAT